MSSGIVGQSPSRYSSVDCPLSPGCAPWIGWGSCIWSPTSTRLRVERAMPTRLATDTCPASSTNNVSRLSRKSSRLNSQAVPATRGKRSSRRQAWAVPATCRAPAQRWNSGSSPLPPTFSSSSRSPASVAHLFSRFRIALWLFEVTPTRIPAASRSRINRAAMVVLPLPGGPWIDSVVRSIEATMRGAASPTDSPGRTRGPPSWSRRRGGRRSRKSVSAVEIDRPSSQR